MRDRQPEPPRDLWARTVGRHRARIGVAAGELARDGLAAPARDPRSAPCRASRSSPSSSARASCRAGSLNGTPATAPGGEPADRRRRPDRRARPAPRRWRSVPVRSAGSGRRPTAASPTTSTKVDEVCPAERQPDCATGQRTATSQQVDLSIRPKSISQSPVNEPGRRRRDRCRRRATPCRRDRPADRANRPRRRPRRRRRSRPRPRASTPEPTDTPVAPSTEPSRPLRPVDRRPPPPSRARRPRPRRSRLGRADGRAHARADAGRSRPTPTRRRRRTSRSSPASRSSASRPRIRRTAPGSRSPPARRTARPARTSTSGGSATSWPRRSPTTTPASSPRGPATGSSAAGRRTPSGDAAGRESFFIDPASGDETAIDGRAWRPVVDPDDHWAVAWDGTVTVGQDSSTAGRRPRAARPARLHRDAAASTPTARLRRSSPTGPFAEFDVRWDETGYVARGLGRRRERSVDRPAQPAPARPGDRRARPAARRAAGRRRRCPGSRSPTAVSPGRPRPARAARAAGSRSWPGPTSGRGGRERPGRERGRHPLEASRCATGRASGARCVVWSAVSCDPAGWS